MRLRRRFTNATRTRHPRRGQAGYTYLFVMFMVVLIGLAATAVARQWKTEIRRDREAELLFRGDQIRQAIGLYYLTARGGSAHVYPRSLDDLVKDPNSSATRRYLRKIYKDPITGDDFELVKEGDAIRGVRSTSTAAPIKTGNFPPEDQDFNGKTSYHDWMFIYQPQGVTPTPVS
ncbi:MAG TPA: type II secretion system protein [Nitrospiria bacterium]|nr:type II secretion system protein [Nitrospiria bacterium]